MLEQIKGQKLVRGRVRAARVTEDGEWQFTREPKHNLVLLDWGKIVVNLLGNATSAYRIAGMYLEYQNVATPETVSTGGALTRSRTVEYYASLGDSNIGGDRDFLRVPISTFGATTDGESRLLFFARSEGIAGVLGTPFGSAHNSKVIGGALVAMPRPEDYTSDLLFSSFYLDSDEQQLKLATGQVGLEWELLFN